MIRGEIVGRQPAVIYITPSQPNPWYGTIVEGQRFTAQQVYWLRVKGIDHETVEAMTVMRQATDREYYWGPGQQAPEFHFECPVLGRRADGRVKVMAPAGDVKLVFGDGWVRRPHKPRRAF